MAGRLLHAPAQHSRGAKQLWPVPSVGALRPLPLAADGADGQEFCGQGAGQHAGQQPLSGSVSLFLSYFVFVL
jgi:hypothetical protein